MRVEDKHIDVGKATERLNGGGACVARGSPDDCDALARALKSGLEHLANDLHGEVFEGERRTVKKLEQEVP